MSEQRQHNLADIKDLSVSFMTDAGSIKAVENVNFAIPRKTVVGVVGESGSGKSVTARSIIKLLPETATTSGAVYLSRRDGSDGLDVLSLSGEQLRDMRGSEAAMVFQEPNSVLNPVYTIGWQIEEGLRAHGLKDRKKLRAKAVDILNKVGIPDAETRVDYYPHQFSGGQKQRIVIAMALVLNPGLILADEPTTALDVTVQAEILDLLRLARDEFDASVLIITHNMGVIAGVYRCAACELEGHRGRAGHFADCGVLCHQRPARRLRADQAAGQTGRGGTRMDAGLRRAGVGFIENHDHRLRARAIRAGTHR